MQGLVTKKRLSALLALTALGSLAALSQSAAAAPPAAEISLSGDYFTHDPSRIISCDGTYYAYCTGKNCPMLSSKDLRRWTWGPPVLAGIPAWMRALVPLAKSDQTTVWAPDVIRINKLYYLYYSFSTFGSKTSAIGLVTSPTLDPTSPRYLWTDRGLVVASNNEGDFNAIDPCPSFDAKGRPWLTFGSWNSGGIQMVALDKKTGKPSSARTFLAAGLSEGPEASFLQYHKPYYYLFENEGLCCRGTNSTYRILVGRSRSVTGPYLDRNGRDMRQGGGTQFRASQGDQIGPGQAGVFSARGRDWFTYHYYDAAARGRPTLGIRPLNWSAEGWPETSDAPGKVGKAAPARAGSVHRSPS